MVILSGGRNLTLGGACQREVAPKQKVQESASASRLRTRKTMSKSRRVRAILGGKARTAATGHSLTPCVCVCAILQQMMQTMDDARLKQKAESGEAAVEETIRIRKKLGASCKPRVASARLH